MTIDNFIPTVWSASVLENLNDAHVFAARCNTDYEGEVKAFGDTVKINSMGRVTTYDYTKNGSLNAPETLVGAQQILRIDQAKYFNFEIDNIDKWQANPDLMGKATQEASWSMSDDVDAWIAALMTAAVPASMTRAPATSVGFDVGDDNPVDVLVDLDVLLTEQNIPRAANRWVVVPPWYEGALRKDVRYTSFGTDKNRANLRGEPIGLSLIHI